MEVDVIERDKCSYKLFFSPQKVLEHTTEQNKKKAAQMGEKSEMTGGDGSTATEDGE